MIINCLVKTFYELDGSGTTQQTAAGIVFPGETVEELLDRLTGYNRTYEVGEWQHDPTTSVELRVCFVPPSTAHGTNKEL